MRAALQISEQGLSCALLSKVFPTRSHTVSAQGGITVALGNSHEDNWEWHMYDTVKGSDYIGDQNAIEYMCKTGPQSIIELEKMGLPFSRFEDGSIYQRPFGGQSKAFGGEQAARTAAAADRTGHALLHTLYQQNIKNKTMIFSEWYALDLVKNQDGAVVGATAMCMESGEICYFKAKATVMATGGAGRIYQSTTNAHINTGDGVGMALRAGVPMQDMEMWQFHPTGIAGAGVLVTEGCRGEGGYLLNKDGERFMERYAPNAKDLAGRDVVARSMMVEIREGRGCDGPWGPHLKLKLDHLGKDVLEARLPGILELSRTFAHIDPIKEPIPVIPTCHYMMGGIPTQISGQAIKQDPNGKDVEIQGLFACGEIASVSVHGANRLGGNSLLDLVVFGRATGLHLGETLAAQVEARDASESDIEASLTRVNRWNSTQKGEDPVQIRKDLQSCMQNNFSVFREGDAMAKGLEELKVIRERLKEARLDDNSSEFNTQRIECLELDNLMETAFSTAVAANYRTESRGAHARFDYQERDDENWLCHTIYNPETEAMTKRDVNMTPIHRDTFVPKAHVDDAPHMKGYALEVPEGSDMMVLDALILLKEQDPTLSFRRSCREGVCGSDGINMNGKNGLACITPLSALTDKSSIVIRPLPGLPVVRDLIVDLTQFYQNYERVKPYLINDSIPPARENLQSPEDRAHLDGLYECIMCACCSTSCPSFWWNPDKFVGPAGLLAAYRWLIDSRDTATEERLSDLDDAFSVFRCHSIMNCVNVCPKGLNPTKAIGHIRSMLLKRAV
eukprot:maker-scaffold709_size108516-snap-gene-0.18 protein:Tk00881 transcript:maker-scaffold709_size108516-snap-gene-0.18-mRNA-1 annotation:"succinate dehydrogenase flavoprotein subunit"